ncbi:hypothetical protein BTA51_07835 [Hahella sp. CCB-MM4]|uniref:hypothetical protein n=1 Tax=Hahella sp. (strain CCB-MM4) TaxID=1926491 RepID=UPI000B9C4044|nr:hypothetical protein [Hahella sp. CCB-MM4]OZG73716.1 hypothetical protein BTA51_07835 [Hahella sp. CCB-MM4]
MSATYITAIIGGIIITVLLLTYVHQWREKSKDARQRELNTLTDRSRRLRRIAIGIPSQYMPKEIGMLLVSRGQETLKELAGYGYKEGLTEKMEEWEIIKQGTQKGDLVPMPNPQDESSQVELRKNLQLLFKFIEAQVKRGRIDKKLGTKYLLQTQYLLAKTLAESHSIKAKQAHKAGKLRIAIHHYHDAVHAFNKLENNPLAQKTIAAYRLRIKELDKLATQESATKSQQGAAPSSAGNKLSSQLEEMMDEEEKWKRKQNYDD